MGAILSQPQRVKEAPHGADFAISRDLVMKGANGQLADENMTKHVHFDVPYSNEELCPPGEGKFHPVYVSRLRFQFRLKKFCQQMLLVSKCLPASG